MTENTDEKNLFCISSVYSTTYKINKSSQTRTGSIFFVQHMHRFVQTSSTIFLNRYGFSIRYQVQPINRELIKSSNTAQ